VHTILVLESKQQLLHRGFDMPRYHEVTCTVVLVTVAQVDALSLCLLPAASWPCIAAAVLGAHLCWKRLPLGQSLL
jgi:hypothetical protein